MKPRAGAFAARLELAKARAQARAAKTGEACHVFRGSAGFPVYTDAEAAALDLPAHEALATFSPDGARLFLINR